MIHSETLINKTFGKLTMITKCVINNSVLNPFGFYCANEFSEFLPIISKVFLFEKFTKEFWERKQSLSLMYEPEI